jgi:hypothetical protein
MQDVRLRKQQILFITVISEAVRDAQEAQPKVREAARDWLLKDDVDLPRICELAGIDCHLFAGESGFADF